MSKLLCATTSASIGKISVCECACTHIHTHMGVKVGGQFWVSFLRSQSTLFLEKGSLTGALIRLS